MDFLFDHVHLGDLAALEAIERASYPSELVTTSAGFSKILAAPHELGHLRCVRIGLSVAGLLHFGVQGEVATLFDLAVAPEFRRRGVGRFALRSWLENLGSVRAVELYVPSDHMGAQGLYQEFGFERVDVLEAYYPWGADAWVMRLKPRAVS